MHDLISKLTDIRYGRIKLKTQTPILASLQFICFYKVTKSYQQLPLFYLISKQIPKLYV